MGKTIVCADALEWLSGREGVGAIVTSLPDADEIGADLDEWAVWFARAAGRCMIAADPDAAAVFYQTDRKAGGGTESKAAMVLATASGLGFNLLWHKIVLRREVNATDLHRPGFTHMIAVSRKGRPGKATPDVINRGQMLYPNAMGLNAAAAAVRFAGIKGRAVVDPFCGRGTVPAVADALGFDAIGVDTDPEQCKRAERLKLARA